MMMGSHRDPSDRRFDWAIVRFETGWHFDDVFPLVDAILATRRTITRDGKSPTVPAFRVSVQPPLQRPVPGPDFELGKPRAPTF
jgi:hypothetical protein